MRVLIFVPLAPKRPRIYARTLTSIMTQVWNEPCEIVFGKHDHEPLKDEGKYFDLLEKYQLARQMTLDGDYDALFTVECDVILPPFALLKLSQVEADVAYGLYVNRHGRHRWLAFDHIADISGASLSDVPDQAAASWGKVVETEGVGLGCTLIHRRVLEKIPFRVDDPRTANDWHFALDCKAQGFVQKHDLSVVCGHIQGEPDPKIYWPEPDGGYSVQFFDEAMPEPVQLSGGYRIQIDKIGSKELFPVPEA